MRDFERRLERLEQRNNLGLAASLTVARLTALERVNNPPSLEQLEVELAAMIEGTEALEKSTIPLSQNLAAARRRAVIPGLEEEIAALKSAPRFRQVRNF